MAYRSTEKSKAINEVIKLIYEHCVFHLEPAAALLVFICVITRPFLVFGVFVGLFRVPRRYDFFGGGHFGQMGPFCAHFSPEGSNREC